MFSEVGPETDLEVTFGNDAGRVLREGELEEGGEGGELGERESEPGSFVSLEVESEAWGLRVNLWSRLAFTFRESDFGRVSEMSLNSVVDSEPSSKSDVAGSISGQKLTDLEIDSESVASPPEADFAGFFESRVQSKIVFEAGGEVPPSDFMKVVHGELVDSVLSGNQELVLGGGVDPSMVWVVKNGSEGQLYCIVEVGKLSLHAFDDVRVEPRSAEPLSWLSFFCLL